MKGKIICYTLGKVTSTKRNKFKRELSGYLDYSNKGEYKYQRKGILSRIPHYIPVRSVIVIRDSDETKIVAFLDKFNAKYDIFKVNISKDLLKS